MQGTLYITGDPDADELLNTDPLALLIGMLLDQQVPMEWAFTAPAKLKERLGGLDAAKIAAMDPEEIDAVFRGPSPRCTGSRARWPSAPTRCASTWSSTTTATPSRVWSDAPLGRGTAQAAAGPPGVR